MIKVLFATSEAVPFAKSGGLADVAGTLPQMLDKDEVDIRVIMPKYGAIEQKYVERMEFIENITVELGWRNQYCGVFKLVHEGVTFYFIDNEFYFSGQNLYGYIHEDVEKFAFFSKAALSVLEDIDFKPDIIHCNDWQSGAIPIFLNAQFQNNPFYAGIKTIMTIHNLKYQGVWDKRAVRDVFGIADEYFSADKLEYMGDLNILKGGIVYSDVITTVSETYAKEIQTSEYGEGLEGLLQAREASLYGIVNGISYEQYSPQSDEMIYKNYNLRNFVSGKAENKNMLQKELGLEERSDVFMLGIVSRLTEQKGFDIIAEIMQGIIDLDIQLVVLGTGEHCYESMFKWYGERYPSKVSSNIRFSNELAHKIYASSDAFLMPSKFEPCGLSQIISLKYGTVPIVRETGGLKDTVFAYNEYDDSGNGFSFLPYRAEDLFCVLKYAYDIFKERKKNWNGIVRRAMKSDNSWEVSAKKYIELYKSIL